MNCEKITLTNKTICFAKFECEKNVEQRANESIDDNDNEKHNDTIDMLDIETRMHDNNIVVHDT